MIQGLAPPDGLTGASAGEARAPSGDADAGAGVAPGRDARPLVAGDTRPLVVLVTGPSGAGRSTAIAALEDLGFEAIDNLPLSLLPRLLAPGAPERPLALGLDARNRDFGADALLAAEATLQARGDLRVEMLYLDCRAEVLLRRYSETRRRHPLAPREDPATGIAREAGLLAGLRERAATLIDTSEMTPHDLRAEIARAYGPRAGGDGAAGVGGLAVRVMSFSYRRGIPAGVDTAFDCRFLRNPHWEPALRPRDGTDAQVAAYVEADPRHAAFLAAALALLRVTVPAHEAEGRAHLTIGVGCTGGQHRSVAVVEALARALATDGVHVSKCHRELERRAAAGPSALGPQGAQGGHPQGRNGGPDAGPGGPGSDRAGRGAA